MELGKGHGPEAKEGGRGRNASVSLRHQLTGTERANIRSKGRLFKRGMTQVSIRNEYRGEVRKA